MKNQQNELSKLDLCKANQIIKMTFLFLFAIALQMYVLLLISIIVFAVIAHKTMHKRSINHVQQILCSCDWGKHHRTIRDALQYLKYLMMITRGYHSKSNTNIILQQEKDLQQHNEQSQEEQIAKQLAKVIEKLTNVSKLKRILMQQGKISIGDDCKEIKLNTFSELFSTSRQVDLLFQGLSQMSILFKQRVHSPAQALDNNDFSINTWQRQMIPALNQLNVQVQNLLSIYNRQFTELALNEEFKEAYHATINKNPDENLIESFEQFIDKCAELLPVQQTQQISENHTVELAFGSDKSEKERLQPITSQSPEVNALERKEFLRKLDMQLMIGLARKQQTLL